MARFHCFWLPSNNLLCTHTHTHTHTIHIFFIYSTIDGHLGSFHTLAIVYSSAINIGCICPFESVFLYPLGKYLIVLLLSHRVVLFLTFWGTSILFPRVTARVCIPSTVRWFPFLYLLANICFSVLLNLAILSGVRWYLIVVVFPWRWVVLSIFSCVCWPSGCLLWENVYSGPLSIF